MPELDIQQREHAGAPWWAWLLGALALIALIWVGVEAFDNDRTARQAPQEVVAGERQVIREGDLLPVAVILASPSSYFGQEVSGVANVTEVISDRGFWVENEGQRAFVILGQGIPEAGVKVRAGDRITLTGTFMESQKLGEMPEIGQLEADTRQAIAGQTGFIRAKAVDLLQPKDGAPAS